MRTNGVRNPRRDRSSSTLASESKSVDPDSGSCAALVSSGATPQNDGPNSSSERPVSRANGSISDYAPPSAPPSFPAPLSAPPSAPPSASSSSSAPPSAPPS